MKNEAIATIEQAEQLMENVKEMLQDSQGKAGRSPETLPKMTIYAHGDVLKTIRMIAVEDGVQAQEILRAALKLYLSGRGYDFEDLATGRRRR